MTTEAAVFACLSALAGLGVITAAVAVTGGPRSTSSAERRASRPAGMRAGPAWLRVDPRGVDRIRAGPQVRDGRWWSRVATCAAASALAGWWTGWPVAAALVAAAVWWLPAVLGPDRAHREEVARIEAVAAWAEQLRDTLAAASGLEQAITATARTAPEPISAALAALAARLQAGDRLPAALLRAGADIADPTADLVIAALVLAARQNARSLGELLTALAATARGEASARMRTAVARARVRTSVRVIMGATLGLTLALSLLNPAYLAAYAGIDGQLVLVAAGALFAAGFWWLASIARPTTYPRLVTSPATGTATGAASAQAGGSGAATW